MFVLYYRPENGVSMDRSACGRLFQTIHLLLRSTMTFTYEKDAITTPNHPLPLKQYPNLHQYDNIQCDVIEHPAKEVLVRSPHTLDNCL